MWKAQNCVMSGATTVTVTYGGSTTFRSLTVWEITGDDPVAAMVGTGVDNSSCASNTCTAAAQNWVVRGSLAILSANESGTLSAPTQTCTGSAQSYSQGTAANLHELFVNNTDVEAGNACTPTWTQTGGTFTEAGVIVIPDLQSAINRFGLRLHKWTGRRAVWSK